MKHTRIILAILLLLILGGLYVWKFQPNVLSSLNLQSLPKTEIDSVTQQLTDKLQPALTQSAPVVNQLSEQTAEVASRAAAVLGTTIGTSELASQPASLIEGTANYARYWYCKQVVDQYEKQF